jgi:hypothetical protein
MASERWTVAGFDVPRGSVSQSFVSPDLAERSLDRVICTLAAGLLRAN